MGLKFISEDDNNYQVEKITKKNIFTRLRITFLFLVFLFVIFTIDKNDYSLVFNKQEILEFSCGPKNTLNPSNDDAEARAEKILRAIESNKSLLSSLVGFEKIYSAQEPRGYQGRNIVMVKILFSQEDPSHKKIPDQMCGFNLEVIYK